MCSPIWLDSCSRPRFSVVGLRRPCKLAPVSANRNGFSCHEAITMYQPRLTQLQQVIRGEIDAGLYHGAVVRVARGGEIVFDTVEGSALGGGQQPLVRNSVFNIFSVTKAFTNALV